MDYFEPNISQEPIINKGGTKKWLLNEHYTPKKKQKEPFTKSEYDKNSNKFYGFGKLKSEFVCANPKCKSKKVECIWHLYQPIDMRVDETFAEFYCPNCGKYTFVEYYRDDR